MVYVVLLITGLIIVFTTDKLALQLSINGLHKTWLDALMPYITWLGDGIFAVLVALLFMLFVNRRIGWMLFFTYVLSAILAQLGKHVFFPDAMRPFAYLKHHPEFYKIPGFLYYEFHSFPSGHSASIFALCSLLAIAYASKWKVQLILLCLACLVGFSRTYLSQHFLVDVISGSFIGVCSSIILWNLIKPERFKNQGPYLSR